MRLAWPSRTPGVRPPVRPLEGCSGSSPVLRRTCGGRPASAPPQAATSARAPARRLARTGPMRPRSSSCRARLRPRRQVRAPWPDPRRSARRVRCQRKETKRDPTPANASDGSSINLPREPFKYRSRAWKWTVRPSAPCPCDGAPWSVSAAGWRRGPRWPLRRMAPVGARRLRSKARLGPLATFRSGPASG